MRFERNLEIRNLNAYPLGKGKHIEKLVHCKASNVSVVNTTGAGDAFNGALAYLVG